MDASCHKLRHLAVEVIVTDVGEFPCPPELSLRSESGIKLCKDNTPDRRTKRGKEWHRRFAIFRDQKLAEWMRS